MLFRPSFRQIHLTLYRKFNWKYPYPRELQPSPPEKESINPENLVNVEHPLSANDKFNHEYINRNPRNLEQMLLEGKPRGFAIDNPNVSFWNKLLFEKSIKNITAKVLHNSGRVIVSASTREWVIRKQLNSTIDDNAVVCVARVLARRCLQSGILFVKKEFTNHELNTVKVKLLLNTLEEEGLKTEELKAVQMKDLRYL